jgi:Ca2+-binding EF-hand superfamily protein
MDGSGSLDYSEFLAASIKHEELLNQENLQAAFNMFDVEKDGLLQLENII